MLMLLFHLDKERYALNSKQVIEVVPLIQPKPQPHAPNQIAGMFNYRGQIVPVIDLCQLIHARSCRTHLSTRIILVNYRFSDAALVSTAAQTTSTQSPCILGLLAERVVETLAVSETDLIDAGMRVETAPYLGKMILDQQGMIQCIRIQDLLTEEQRSLLFATHDPVGS